MSSLAAVFWLATISARWRWPSAVLVCTPSAQNAIGNVSADAIAMRVESLIESSLSIVNIPRAQTSRRQYAVGIREIGMIEPCYFLVKCHRDATTRIVLAI